MTTEPPIGNRMLERRPVRVALYLTVILVLVAAYRFRFLPVAADALLDFFLFMCCATTLTPLPTIPAILYAASHAPPVLVGLIGAAGTTVAYLIEYAVLGSVLDMTRLRGVRTRVQSSTIYAWLSDLFTRAPFAALSLASFLPLPVDGVRLLSIVERYRRDRYALAAFTGRLPRYWLIAALGRQVDWSQPAVLWIAAGVVVIGLAFYLYRRRQLRGSATGTRVAVLLLAGGVAVAGHTWAGASPPESVGVSSLEIDRRLARLDQAVEGIDRVHARFRQTRWSAVFEDVESSEGELWYRAPGDLVLRYRKPEHQEVFIDSAGVWVYLVKQRQAQRYPFADETERDASLAVLWRSSSELAAGYRIEPAAEPPETGGVWLALSPRAEDLARVVRVLFLRLDPSTGLTNCLVVERMNGERVRLEVIDPEPAPSAPDERFRFVPPEGVELVHF